MKLAMTKESSTSRICHFIISIISALQISRLLAQGSAQHIGTCLVAAYLVANHALRGIHIGLTFELELLAEVLGVPCARPVTCPAGTVVLTLASGGAAGRNVALVGCRVKRIALLGADGSERFASPILVVGRL
jgi:hypothetical protein